MMSDPAAARPTRLFRSELAVPGSQPKMFEKAARSAADAVYLDLEDAVAFADKATARANVVDALNGIDWGRRTVEVRINGLDTPFMFRDVIDIVGRCPRIDVLIIPKVGTAADLHAVEMLVGQVEMEAGRSKRTGLVALVESAMGIANIESIAASGTQPASRLEGITFGSGDFAASTRMRTTSIGGVTPHYGVLTDPATGQPGGARGDHQRLLRDQLVDQQRIQHGRRRPAHLLGQLLRRLGDVGEPDVLAVHPRHHGVGRLGAGGRGEQQGEGEHGAETHRERPCGRTCRPSAR